MPKTLYKTITGDTQVYVGRCFFFGAEITRLAAAATTMKIYDEASTDKTAGQLIATLNTTPEKQTDRIMLDKDREIECVGLYVDWAAGLGTIYYHT